MQQQGALQRGNSENPGLQVDNTDPNRPTVRLSGVWRLHHGMPTAQQVEPELFSRQTPRLVHVDGARLAAWDSSVVSFLTGLLQICNARQITLDRSALPEGLNRLVDLAGTNAEPLRAPVGAQDSLLARIGQNMLVRLAAFSGYVDFIGNVVLGLGAAAIGRARYRRIDLVEVVQGAGANALGIVTLISYLVGIIMGFMGAVQLQQFGASIYVADLVAIAIVREMGAMMTGVIMSGRTGAAFAAQLGSMKVTQEIDALATMGISPIEFLVVPRVIGLVLMMPLLCLYADFVGILGGATVGVGMLGLTLNSYLQQTIIAITLPGLIGGLFKSIVYGVLIAIAGCYQGFQCGRSSSAVGDAATAAVVSAIVMIVVACGIFAVVFNVLGI
ncbi:MAG TPA: ABC transporter permease [Candidatus Binataceae bacterium]|nr:ABC transporter permease [Candidatus Binataceae bacterium]